MHSNNKIAFYNTVAQCSVVIMAKTHDINKKNKMPPEKRDLITLHDYYLKKKKNNTSRFKIKMEKNCFCLQFFIFSGGVIYVLTVYVLSN